MPSNAYTLKFPWVQTDIDLSWLWVSVSPIRLGSGSSIAADRNFCTIVSSKMLAGYG